MVEVCRFVALVDEVMELGVLTSETMHRIDDHLRQRDYTPADVNALDR